MLRVSLLAISEFLTFNLLTIKLPLLFKKSPNLNIQTFLTNVHVSVKDEWKADRRNMVGPSEGVTDGPTDEQRNMQRWLASATAAV